jgi:hypothetical protein
MMPASGKWCSCRSAECCTPRRWPLTRPSRSSAVPPPATWWMWRRCLSGTTLEQLCELAPEKDAGFDRRVLAYALAAAAAHSDAAFAELGLKPEDVAALRVCAARRRVQLLDAGGVSTSAARRPFGAPTLRPEGPGSPSRTRSAERHRPPPSNGGRAGPSPSL